MQIKEWDYKIVQTETPIISEVTISYQAKVGWELCGCIGIPFNYVYYFKRPKYTDKSILKDASISKQPLAKQPK